MSSESSTPEDDLKRSLIEFLSECSQEKRAFRIQKEVQDRRDVAASHWSNFWSWWKEYGTSLSTLVTILSIGVGGLWTVNEYLVQEKSKVEQQRRDEELQRETRIAEFAKELGDKTKRNSAVYALAVFSKERAIPLLEQHLLDASRTEDGKEFAEAIVQAFIHMGEPAIPPLNNMNRDRHGEAYGDAVRLYSSRVIADYLRRHTKDFIDKKVELAGVTLRGADLSWLSLGGSNLGGINFVNGRFCHTVLHQAILNNASFSDTALIGVNLEASSLVKTSFRNSDLNGVRLTRTRGEETDFSKSDLEGASLEEAFLKDAIFDHANLEAANLSGANLSGANFRSTILYNARLVNATLVGAGFEAANVEDADFSGSDLAEVKFSLFEGTPALLKTRGTQDFGAGAWVARANFEGAKHVGEGLSFPRYVVFHG